MAVGIAINVGDTFESNNCGKIKVLEVINSRKIKVEFLDDETQVYVRADHIKTGQIKNPNKTSRYEKGYIGQGKYNSKDKFYSLWTSKLCAAFNAKYKKEHPAYRDATIADELLNFQVFAEWCHEIFWQAGDETMHLDKDILTKGNKCYCKEHCIFVPEAINYIFITHKENRGEYPIGVYKARDKYGVQCRVGEINEKCIVYDTPEEAFYAYKRIKEAEIKRVAQEYMDKYPNVMPKRLYDAMLNYEVEITD